MSVIELFQHSNYGGNSLLIGSNAQIPDLTGFGMNDKFSSYKLTSPNYIVSFYQHVNYSGEKLSLRCPVLSQINYPNLSNCGWNDKISSLKVEQFSPVGTGLPGVQLYTSPPTVPGVNGRIQFFHVGESIYNLDDTCINNDNAATFIIWPGTTMILYDKQNYTGNSWTFTLPSTHGTVYFSGTIDASLYKKAASLKVLAAP